MMERERKRERKKKERERGRERKRRKMMIKSNDFVFEIQVNKFLLLFDS